MEFITILGVQQIEEKLKVRKTVLSRGEPR
ncbi:hypothetical protein J5U23_02321 [Saccharolobus shibatae B12]|uniref:Uncharacterized protein n=2 Tax=Saccharolobus shibatae TaxID=2286 RepID=A0A8F5BPK0_SACSH|nr:hypothetical protein J5U23_00560 [Saccharolobus shibatae B12]QXJ31961.1 hypothetical protein J5U21_01612 [Saccharolobus shibatae]QXJ28097.1 hypothetical protein J5U23_00965 [Saccharolobus shibatae B12]QXJ28675.1 hypothetical protein J5U23_01544 [Saccharolobus shibatae B12]QXJ28701.1 hypothetical protein J5U23_01570 [Saccharolobus shibatae B12]